MSEPIHYLNLRDLSGRIRAQDLSPVDVVDAALARIEAFQSRLNAFITVLADDARARAKEAQDEIRGGTWRGPLHGVPVGIKDFYDTANVRTTAAFERFKDRIPVRDAVAVAALQAAGAIVIGKMNMHQLGMGTTGLEGDFGPVQNPWNAAYIPGGSSSGSAAAVAAGLCYATLDTDAIGSCRLPAACCGVVGFKGTYGAISAGGILDGEPVDPAIIWMSHPGITTRSARDTAIVLDVLATPEARTEMSDLSADRTTQAPLRIGVADNAKADAAVVRGIAAAVATIRSLGHETVSAAAPFDIPRMGDLHRIEADRASIAERAFKKIDVLLLPTLTTTVPAVKDVRGNPQALSPAHTMFANYFGLPAISMPCGFDTRDLPIGLQIVGKPWHDATVLRLARQYEIAAPTNQHPLA
ncbi:MAG TPA: amidase [Vicinamibacterales bacterium]|nr:amidase [Vicinamibacterales bacterium]